jgi:hypothetical protein
MQLKSPGDIAYIILKAVYPDRAPQERVADPAYRVIEKIIRADRAQVLASPTFNELVDCRGGSLEYLTYWLAIRRFICRLGHMRTPSAQSRELMMKRIATLRRQRKAKRAQRS